jgi:ABC-type multidrug transport system fused ATPase/permease subunit
MKPRRVLTLETDAKIQMNKYSLRVLSNSTFLLCIADRLRTVIDYQRVLVLDYYGYVVEYDTPLYLILSGDVFQFMHEMELFIPYGYTSSSSYSQEFLYY